MASCPYLAQSPMPLQADQVNSAAAQAVAPAAPPCTPHAPTQPLLHALTQVHAGWLGEHPSLCGLWLQQHPWYDLSHMRSKKTTHSCRYACMQMLTPLMRSGEQPSLVV